nr:ORF 1 [Marmot picobirnavirus]
MKGGQHMTTMELRAVELEEMKRHNLAMERLQDVQMGETARHNLRQESIAHQANVNDFTKNSQTYSLGMRNAGISAMNAQSTAIQAQAFADNVTSQVADRVVNQGISQQNADTNATNAETNRSNWLTTNDLAGANIAQAEAQTDLLRAQEDRAKTDNTLAWLKAPGQIFSEWMGGVNQLSNAVPIWGLLTK